MQTCLLHDQTSASKDIKCAIARAAIRSNQLTSAEKESVMQTLRMPCDHANNTRSNDQCLMPYQPINRTTAPSYDNQIAKQLTCGFCHSDEASRIDSNSMRCTTITHNRSTEKYSGRVWDVSTWKER